MDTGVLDAVLKAADEWVLAQEVLVAAKQTSLDTEAEEEAADIAGCLLAAAVARWRQRRSGELQDPRLRGDAVRTLQLA